MKVKWSHVAKRQFNDILRFYRDRNGSPHYGNRLKSSVRKIIEYVKESPLYGEYLESEKKRRVCVEYFELIYEIKNGAIEISSFRDARRDWER